MASEISRRDFLKLGALSLSSMAARPSKGLFSEAGSGLIGRVAYESVSVFDSPRLDARTLSFRFRDDLLNIHYPVTPLRGPAYNPLWYRIEGGYVHSALVQPVGIQFNEVLDGLPEGGRLSRLTVPSSQPYTFSSQNGWLREERYLLYFDSNHWLTDIVEGPDGEAWYQITEAWEQVQYYVAAKHLEPFADEELTPISPDVPAGEKHMEVSLAKQSLTAYEGNEIILKTSISSGVRDSSNNSGLPTETPTGTFNVNSKLSAKYMGASRLTDNLGDKFLPGVPWTAFFAEGGYAIHGAYWHNNFGAPMSRGCINVPPKKAQWLYRWMTPTADADEWEARGFGTRLVVS
jgi:hypothetical protein